MRLPMMSVLALALGLATHSCAQAAAPAQPCTPPAKAGALMGMSGCVQPDGSLLTAKGFRIGIKRGAAGGSKVEITPPDSGAGFEISKIDQLIEQDAEALQAEGDKADAGLERHALREAAAINRRFATALQDAAAEAFDIEPPAKGASPAKPQPVPPDLETWCAGMTTTASWAASHWALPLAGRKYPPHSLPPIPPPPSMDYFDCYGCDLDKQEQYEKDSREWVSKQWFGNYLEPERRTLRAVLDYSKKEFSDGPALKQAALQPGSACASLAATGDTLRGGMDAPLFNIALNRMGDKGNELYRRYGHYTQYPTYWPVALAYIAQLKEEQLLRASDLNLAGAVNFIVKQLGSLQLEWYRRLSSDGDLGQLSNIAVIIAFAKQESLLASEPIAVQDYLDRGVLDLSLKFQVKLAGQSAGAEGYVLAQVSGGTTVYAYTDPKDRKCGLLRSVDYSAGYPQDAAMWMRIYKTEMFGPGLRNKYVSDRAPNDFKSTVVIDLPCCRKNLAPDKAIVYIESLGPQAARGEKETWSMPGLAPFPVIDSWFRLAFNTGALMKMVDSGQADAEMAGMEKDMAVKMAEMEALQQRYDNGKASLADLLAGATEIKDSLTGGGSVGKNAFLSQAQHYRLEVPFTNFQKTPITVKLDARQLLKGGGEAAEGVLENLAYGFGDIKLTLRKTHKTPGRARPSIHVQTAPVRWTQQETEQFHQSHR